MASRSHFAAPLLLAVFIGLIVYVSLFPFRFVAHGPTMFEAVRPLTWARAGRGDMFNNVLLYAPLGFCCVLLLEPRFGRVPGSSIATMPAPLVAAASNCCRPPSRRASQPRDLSLNTLGTLLGTVLGIDLAHLRRRMSPQSAAAQPLGVVAMSILVLWLVARLWPLIPDPGLRQLKRAVRPLFTPRIDWMALAGFLVGWLVVTQVVFQSRCAAALHRCVPDRDRDRAGGAHVRRRQHARDLGDRGDRAVAAGAGASLAGWRTARARRSSRVTLGGWLAWIASVRW